MKRSRWRVLWDAITKWWKNEQAPAIPTELLENARTYLREYDELYSERVKIVVRSRNMSSANYSSQAAEAVRQEGHKRQPGIESEIRVLALILERILGHLEIDAQESRR